MLNGVLNESTDGGRELSLDSVQFSDSSLAKNILTYAYCSINFMAE